MSENIASGESDLLSPAARLPQCVYCQRKDDIAIAERGLPPTTTQAAPPSHLPMHIATPRALRGLASGMCRLRLVLGMCAVPTSLFGQDPHLGCRCVPRPFGSAARALPPCQPSHKTRQRLRHHDARRGRLAALLRAPPCGASAVCESRFAHTLRERVLVSLDAKHAAHARDVCVSASSPSSSPSSPLPPIPCVSCLSHRCSVSLSNKRSLSLSGPSLGHPIP